MKDVGQAACLYFYLEHLQCDDVLTSVSTDTLC